MKGKTLKLACLAGIIFLMVMLPSCSLFDTISGTWNGEIDIEIEWTSTITESGQSDITVTLTKSGSAVTGTIDSADDFETYTDFLIVVPKEWDVPGSISGTVDGKSVNLNFEMETSYVSDGGNYVEVIVSGSFIGTVDGSMMSGTVDGQYEFIVDGTPWDEFDITGDFLLVKAN